MKTIPEIIKMLKKDIIKIENQISKLNPNNHFYEEQKKLLNRKLLAVKDDLTDWEIINEN